MLNNQQLEARKSGLFSTDAAGALGLSKYKTPVSVWLEKTGQTEPPDISGIEAVKMGNIMEPVIARLYSEAVGTPIVYLGDQTRWHKSKKWMGSHYDYGLGDGSKLIEIKNFSTMRRKEFGENGEGDVPVDVLIQCIHEAAVSGISAVDVAVLFGGQEFCIFPLVVDDAAIDRLVSLEEGFWENFVVPLVYPEPRTEEETRLLFKRDNGNSLPASNEVLTAVRQLRGVRDAIKSLEEKESELKVMIQNDLAECSTLIGHDGEILATWKKAKASATFERKKFADENPAMYARYITTTEGSRRFLLK